MSQTPNTPISALQQRDELHAAIWRIADDVRGAVDGWDFKQYVLCTLFYRFISEHFVQYVDPDGSSDYLHMPEADIDPEAIEEIVNAKGYFIRPAQLFANIVEHANTNPNLNTDLAAAFAAIEASAVGHPSEPAIKGLFADFDTTSTRLGTTVEEKNRRLAAVLTGVASLNLSNFADSEIDLFGDAYEFLISNYAQSAGKSGGEFFTPPTGVEAPRTHRHPRTRAHQQNLRPRLRQRFALAPSQEAI